MGECLMKKFFALAAIPLLFLSNLSLEASAEESSASLSVDAFSTLPAIRSMSISPDGKLLAAVKSSSKNGDYYIEIRDVNDLTKKPVRLGADKMLVSNISWLNNERILVSFRQILRDSGRSYWVSKFAITDADGKGGWLEPFKSKGNISFGVLDFLPKDKKHILVQVDINDNFIPDVVKMNIKTGRTKTVLRGNTKVSQSFVADSDGEIRAAGGWNSKDDTIDLFVRAKGETDWQVVYQNSPSNREDFEFLGFDDQEPNKVYVKAHRGEDKSGIYTYDLKTKSFSERLFGLKGVDVDGARFDKWGKLVSFTYTTKSPQQYFVDPEEEALYQSLAPLFEGKHLSITSRADDDSVIVLRTMSSRDPGTYYLLRDKKQLEELGNVSPQLVPEKLADLKYITYKARDGRKVKAYVTIPNGKPPFPAVVMPHGGPWVRDVVIYDEWAQMLASNGYLVVQPQYRGSTGFGLDHWKAGDKNWGLTMQDDLDDAALFLVGKGLAEKDKLAMFGWSYGGYAALVASMRKNNIYQCSVAGASVASIDRWNSIVGRSLYLREFQKPTIAGVSPVDQVENVNIPLLVVHGDIDERVSIKHSREFVEKLKKHNKDFEYIELKDADHFSDRLFYDHKVEFYTATLDFFKNKCQM